VAGVCGALSYGLCYVLTELVQKADDAPPPEALCVFLGMIGTPVIGLWVVAWAGANGSHFSLLLGIKKDHHHTIAKTDLGPS
jgi:hypothetical protein